jgi:hypothetical protein
MLDRSCLVQDRLFCFYPHELFFALHEFARKLSRVRLMAAAAAKHVALLLLAVAVAR